MKPMYLRRYERRSEIAAHNARRKACSTRRQYIKGETALTVRASLLVTLVSLLQKHVVNHLAHEVAAEASRTGRQQL